MNEEKKVYYIEAITSASTRIGKTAIMPDKAPVPFTEKQFNANKPDIEHYEKVGIIMVSRPGSKKSARAASQIKAEIARQDEIVAGGKPPPAPMVRKLGFIESEPPDTIPTVSAPAEADDYRCVAITTRGTRCQKDAIPECVVCNSHMRMLKNGKEVLNYAGKKIAQDGKSVAQ